MKKYYLLYSEQSDEKNGHAVYEVKGKGKFKVSEIFTNPESFHKNKYEDKKLIFDYPIQEFDLKFVSSNSKNKFNLNFVNDKWYNIKIFDKIDLKSEVEEMLKNLKPIKK